MLKILSLVFLFTLSLLPGVIPTAFALGDPISEVISTWFKHAHTVIMAAAVLIGLVLIAVHSYGLMTSQGDPRKVADSKEGLTSAIIGLLFVLASVSILRVVLGAILGGGSMPW